MTLHLTPEDSAEIKLHCTITFAGEDVIGGVQDMVETGVIREAFTLRKHYYNYKLWGIRN